MKEKKTIKISLKTAVILAIIIILITTGIIFLAIKNKNENLEECSISKYVDVKKYNDNDYYIIKKDYEGEYDLQFLDLSKYYESDIDIRNDFEKKEVMNYSDYKKYCEKWKIKTKYSNSDKNYIIFTYLSIGTPILEARLATVEYKENNVNIYLWDTSSGVTADISAYALIVPTDKIINNINVIGTITKEEYKNIKNPNYTNHPVVEVKKPIIYLYPTKEQEILVRLLNDEVITCSYPKYNEKWKVLAKPNGDLIDLYTNKELYSLYYESKNEIDFNLGNEGFIIKGEKSAEFLEQKLALLGLTPRESEELIIYWLPKLEANKYNYIRFATNEEIDKNMPLEIIPTPDTKIRVWMIFKGLEKPINVTEQKIVTPERKGFTFVEWGGTEIK